MAQLQIALETFLDQETIVKDSEHQLRALADAIPLIVWTSDANGELDYYNRRWETYTGYTAAQTKGWGWGPVLHEDDLERCINSWTQAVHSGEPYEIEYRFKRASDNTYRWHLGRAIPFKDKTGHIIKWIGTCTDIDDQIKAREQLNQAYINIENVVKERTAELAAANQMLIRQNAVRKVAVEALQRDTERLNEIITTQYKLAKAVLDIDAFILLVAQRMSLLTTANGVVVEMAEGNDMVYRAAIGTASPYVGIRLQMDNSLSGLCVQSREVLICNDTESDPRVNLEACRRVHARAMVVAPLFHQGKPIGVLKIMGQEPNAFNERDVQTLQLMAGLIGAAIGHQSDYDTKRRLLNERTEAINALQKEIEHRILVEEAVRANESRTRNIIDSSYDAFIAIDSDGIIIDWNQQAEVIFGWTRQESLGVALGELIIPQKFRQAHSEGMLRFLTTGKGPVLDQRIELVALRCNGEEFPVELTIRSIQHLGQYEFCAFLRDITERRETERRLLYLAQNDQLTGIPNRSLFNDRIHEAMKRTRRNKSLMALMYLDIDYFKSINDGYGHKVGDGLLKEFARRLRASVRTTDTVARLGGDEFTIIMENLKNPVDAEHLAAKIIEHIRQEVQIDEVQLHITTSIGIAFFSDDELDPDQLINNADKALYRAKEAGRDQACL